MSKEEEFLRKAYTDGNHFKEGLYPMSRQRPRIYKAMNSYADFVLSEYLKKESEGSGVVSNGRAMANHPGLCECTNKKMVTNREKWDTALTDAIVEFEGKIEHYYKVLEFLSERFEIMTKGELNTIISECLDSSKDRESYLWDPKPWCDNVPKNKKEWIDDYLPRGITQVCNNTEVADLQRLIENKNGVIHTYESKYDSSNPKVVIVRSIKDLIFRDGLVLEDILLDDHQCQEFRQKHGYSFTPTN